MEARLHSLTEIPRIASFEQEQLRLVSGYNDIFAGIACIITFVSLSTLINAHYLDQVLLLGAAFGLGWYFVRRQRMRFTGIVISCSVALSGILLGIEFFLIGAVLPSSHLSGDAIRLPLALPGVVPLLLSALLSMGFWRFAHVPLAHALGILALLLTIVVIVVWTQLPPPLHADAYDEMAVVTSLDPRSQLETISGFPVLITMFLCGCLAEIYAIWWDIRDPRRQSVDTDIAFWTHIVAAPFIVQPLYWWIEDIAWNPVSEVVLGFLLFLLLLVFALVINRRALLIGAMVWVLAALFTLADMAIAGLTMGVMLLLIAVAWNKSRQLIEPIMPESLQRHFPTLVAEP